MWFQHVGNVIGSHCWIYFVGLPRSLDRQSCDCHYLPIVINDLIFPDYQSATGVLLRQNYVSLSLLIFLVLEWLLPCQTFIVDDGID
jgi:hypothetical protein